jgi:hypothetical protein
MGGQACVLYGGAEFSRDTDIVVLAEPENLDRLSNALAELQAERIAVPPFAAEYLQKGHAIHFRCRHPEAERLRIDIMSVLRGVAPFHELWQRRATMELGGMPTLELLSLPDLINAKKTQRDKDWPMIRRLVEAHYARHAADATPEQVGFWFRQGRTESLLLALGQRFPQVLRELTGVRPLLTFVAGGNHAGLAAALEEEEKKEREADRQYWLPLRKELEELRRHRQGN